MSNLEKSSGKKRMTWLLWSLTVLCFPCSGLHSQTAIGHWRDCLDYSKVLHVEPANDGVYAAGRGGLFHFDPDDRTLKVMSKASGLNDVGVATVAYDSQTRYLVVAYNNSNVDLVQGGRVFNISDIKRSDIGGDKNIYRIRFRRGYAYLATGFGIVVVDLARHEIKETCYIGAGGAYTPVHDVAFTSDSIYAATGEGVKRIALGERYLTISDRWQLDTRLNGVTVTMLEAFDGKLLAAGYSFDPEELTLYQKTDTGYHAWNNGAVLSMRAGGGRLTLTRDSSVVRYDTAFQMIDSLTAYTWGYLTCFDAVTSDDGTLWAGHSWDGLIRFTATGDEAFHPAGPFSGDYVYSLTPFNYRMLVCPGGHNSFYGNAYLPADLFTTDGRSWRSLDLSNGMLASATDLLSADVNPNDTNEIVAALWGRGVVFIRNNKVQALYDENNTGGALVPFFSGGISTLRTGAVTFDGDGNLWVLNSHSGYALARRTASGTWKGFSTSRLDDMPSLDKLIWDSINHYLWFCGRSNVIYVHDGDGRMAKVNPNNGSKLSTDNVTALVQDRTGNLWVGTNKGIKVIYDAAKAFQYGGAGEVSPVTCSNITITNGEFYEYLMAYESITAIAVDGANRKWVGTAAGGLYLISANGMDQLEHFTAENSPLFSNKIVTLAIQPRTGEVYIGTEQGLQVYRSTATYAVGTPLDDIHAFPNPVRPGYEGPIAIKGFVRDAMVHITDAAGHTVYSTQALGGQAIWNGRTVNGERVAAGVYYVFAADNEGGNRSVAKILIVR